MHLILLEVSEKLAVLIGKHTNKFSLSREALGKKIRAKRCHRGHQWKAIFLDRCTKLVAERACQYIFCQNLLIKLKKFTL